MAESPQLPPEQETQERRRLFRSLAIALVLFAAVAVLLGLLEYHVVTLLLLLFAGVLLAVLLGGLGDAVARYLQVGHGVGLAIVLGGLILLAVLAVWLLLPGLAAQFSQLADRLPVALDEFRRQLQQTKWSRYLLRQVPPAQELLGGTSDMLSQATGLVTTVFDIVVYVVVVLFVGIYLAAEPAVYVNGVVRLMAQRYRRRAREVLRTLGYTLRWWLIGQGIAMVVIGIVTGLGLWLLGIPLWLPLGVLAALFNFIPNFGPLISLIPAGLIALTINPSLVFYVVLLYLVAQSFEGYILTPLVQRRAVLLPPAVTITTQVLMGWLVGALGVMLAAPLAAAMLVLLKMAYVEDVLEDRMLVPGEARAKEKAAHDEHKKNVDRAEEREEAEKREQEERNENEQQ